MRAPSEQVHTYKCAMCGKQKQNSNRWFKASVIERDVMGNTAPEYARGRLVIAPMKEHLDVFTWALCGEECLRILVTEWAREAEDLPAPKAFVGGEQRR